MILIDANILIYAHVSSFAQHTVARDWLDQQLNSSARLVCMGQRACLPASGDEPTRVRTPGTDWRCLPASAHPVYI
jgi:hypothetical protein